MVAQDNKSVPSEEGKEKKKTVEKVEEKKTVEKVEEVKKVETKVEEKKEVKESKKPEIKHKEIPKKDVAIANGYSLKISPRQSKYVCRIIKRKTPEAAIARLQAVIDHKRPVPMAGLEVGHKKGKGLAGGKFPENACKAIMEIVKQAGANSVVAGIDNPVITIAKADRASAPYRRAGQRAKRTHMHIEIRDKKSLIKTKARKSVPSKKGTKVPSSLGKKTGGKK